MIWKMEFLEVPKNWFAHPNVALFRWIVAAIARNAKSLVDVGCGRGDFLRYIRSQSPGLALCGIDLSTNAKQEGIEFIQGDVFTMSLNRRFDVVVSLAAIEHVPDIRDFVSTLVELCTPNGQIIIMTINESGIIYFVARVAKRFFVPIAFDRLYSAHHLHHFTLTSFARLLEQAGLTIQKTHLHNGPMAAVDMPVNNRLTKAFFVICVAILFFLGKETRRPLLQTIVSTKPGRPAAAANASVRRRRRAR